MTLSRNGDSGYHVASAEGPGIYSTEEDRAVARRALAAAAGRLRISGCIHTLTFRLTPTLAQCALCHVVLNRPEVPDAE